MQTSKKDVSLTNDFGKEMQGPMVRMGRTCLHFMHEELAVKIAVNS